MRISGGKARGIPLRVKQKEGGSGQRSKPVGNVSFRLSLRKWKTPQVLDLFAGSGAYGLESLSRGAKQATLVEKNRLVFNDLKTNLAAVLKSANLEGKQAELINRDVLDFAKEPPSQNYDIIFIDPPYAEIEKLGPRLIELTFRNQYLSGRWHAVLETPGELKMSPPDGPSTNHWEREKRITDSPDLLSRPSPTRPVISGEIPQRQPSPSPPAKPAAHMAKSKLQFLLIIPVPTWDQPRSGPTASKVFSLQGS